MIDSNAFRNRPSSLERVHLEIGIAGQVSGDAQVAALTEYWHPTALLSYSDQRIATTSLAEDSKSNNRSGRIRACSTALLQASLSARVMSSRHGLLTPM